MKIPPRSVTGVILAGGRARRMGGQDKGLLPWHGHPLIVHASEILKPLCGIILINANRNLKTYRRFGLPVTEDSHPGFQGPLAGILSALQTTSTPYLLAIPCDTPKLRSITLARLLDTLAHGNSDIALPHDGGRLHPVIMALRTSLSGDLASWLDGGGRKIDHWVQRHRWQAVDCSDAPHQFHNINTPQDFQDHGQTDE